jgi:hypothetical protein
MLIDPFIEFAWMSPHYRKVSQRSDFATMNTPSRWQALRTQIVADKPENLDRLLQQMDSVPKMDRSDLLTYLPTPAL